MPDIPQLAGPSGGPASGGKPKQVVILAHGLGANGDDLIGLAPYYAQVLPDALFISPNAPFACDMGGFGYQWFSYQDRAPGPVLAGVRAAAPILDAFIDRVLAETGLPDDKLALVGFSQGTMMSLFVSLRRVLACRIPLTPRGSRSAPDSWRACWACPRQPSPASLT
jgi:phospholipase/carboxylesterase